MSTVDLEQIGFRPVRERSVVEAAVGMVVELVRGGALREGQRLPAERALAESMEISRPTLRLALEHLQTLGLLVRGDGGRLVVASRWIPDAALTLHALEPGELLALLEARRVIEPQLAVLASVRASDDDLDALQATIEEQAEYGAIRRLAVQAEGRFHRRLWRLADNRPLELAIQSVFGRLDVVLDVAMRTSADVEASLAVHRLTLQAIRSGDRERVLAAMDEHLELLESLYEDTTGRSFHRRTALGHRSQRER